MVLDRDSEHAADTRQGIYLAIIGMACLYVSIPAIMWAVNASVTDTHSTVFFIPVVDPDISISLTPPLTGGEAAIDQWSQNLLSGVLRAALVVVYYTMLIAAVLGGLSLSIGVSIIGGIGEVVELLKKGLSDVRIVFVLVVYLGLGLSVVVPAVFIALVEVTLAVAVGGSLFVLFLLGWLSLRDRVGYRGRVLFVYPLLIAAAVLPIAGVALLSPTFAAEARVVTDYIAFLILSEVLVVGGINDWIWDTFDLEGSTFFLMWVSVTVVVGWIVGLIAETVGSMRSKSGADESVDRILR